MWYVYVCVSEWVCVRVCVCVCRQVDKLFAIVYLLYVGKTSNSVKRREALKPAQTIIIFRLENCAKNPTQNSRKDFENMLF